jgi:hypothetical protein
MTPLMGKKVLRMAPKLMQTFSRQWLGLTPVCSFSLQLRPVTKAYLPDEIEEDDDNVHAFEIKDDKIDVRFCRVSIHDNNQNNLQ